MIPKVSWKRKLEGESFEEMAYKLAKSIEGTSIEQPQDVEQNKEIISVLASVKSSQVGTSSSMVNLTNKSPGRGKKSLWR